MSKMSNHAVVSFFRQNVLQVREIRLQTGIPAEHDAYDVTRSPEQVVVRLFCEGREVFDCIFVPPDSY